MKTKLLKKLRHQAVGFRSIERDSNNNIKCYIGDRHVCTFFNTHKFIRSMTEIWHDEANVYIDKHKRKTKRESPYIW